MGRVNTVFSNVESSLSTAKKELDSEWNDGVRESFYGFFDEVAAHQRQIINLISDIEARMTQIEDINIASITNDVRSAIAEVNE